MTGPFRETVEPCRRCAERDAKDLEDKLADAFLFRTPPQKKRFLVHAGLLFSVAMIVLAGVTDWAHLHAPSPIYSCVLAADAVTFVWALYVVLS